MRKLLVKQFVGYTTYTSTKPKELGFTFFLPAFIACLVMTGFEDWIVLTVLGGLFAICLLPIFKKVQVQRVRASRVLYPSYLTIFLFIAKTYPISWAWYHCIAVALLVLLFWLGFNGYGIAYFDLWPVDSSELDEEQLRDFEQDKVRFSLKIKGR